MNSQFFKGVRCAGAMDFRPYHIVNVGSSVFGKGFARQFAGVSDNAKIVFFGTQSNNAMVGHHDAIKQCKV
jgi:hypothetical protein